MALGRPEPFMKMNLSVASQTPPPPPPCLAYILQNPFPPVPNPTNNPYSPNS